MANMSFEAHSLFEAPSDPAAPIFRYMDLAKFVALLSTRSLFFARADQLGDAFEGSTTTASLRVREEFLKQLAPTAVEEFLTLRRIVPFMTFISCWSASSTESNAMWQTYVGGGNGLAIESSYERLTRALGGKTPVHVGTVQYVDYKIDAVPEHNMFLPFLHKRAEFRDEREVRAIVRYIPAGGISDGERDAPSGLPIPVNVRGLVARVRVSPASAAWYHQVVKSVIVRYGYKLDVVHSDLAGQPVF